MYGDGTGGGTRYTVREAAEVLGISAEAVRARIRRDTLHHVKDEDGTVYVLLSGVERTYGRTDGDGTHDGTALVEALQSEIAHLRDEARRRDERHAAEILRRDHIIAAALERIPALDAPAAPDSAPDSTEASAPPTAEAGRDAPTHRPWWRRLFD